MRFTLASVATILSAISSASALSAADIPADTPVSNLLSTAQIHLSKGETSDALLYYDVAVARDPSNYLTLFKRATTYLSLGRVSQATEDFNQVLALKPGFKGAHAQLANIKARNADWEGARAEYKLAGLGRGDKDVDELEAAVVAATSGLAAAEAQDWDKCSSELGVAIHVANRAASLREARYKCRVKQGSIVEAIADLQHLLHIRSSDTTPYRISAALAFFSMDDMKAGMEHIRGCLLSDPDSKACLKQRREMKNLQKAIDKAVKNIEGGRPSTAIKTLVPAGDEKGILDDVQEAMKGLETTGILPAGVQSGLYNRLVELTCRAFYESGSKRASEYCPQALTTNPTSLYGLLHKAKLATQAEDFEDAVRILTSALEAHPSARPTITEPLQKAQVALKRSKTKDYYKVLGVPNTADDRAIKKAYRAKTKEFHPDKIAKKGISKEDAEKKMIAINEAYEVLSDPVLRERFDRGDDPNDHEQQRQNANPFGNRGGGFPFDFRGGGGFPGGSQQFHFKF